MARVALAAASGSLPPLDRSQHFDRQVPTLPVRTVRTGPSPPRRMLWCRFPRADVGCRRSIWAERMTGRRDLAAVRLISSSIGFEVLAYIKVSSNLRGSIYVHTRPLAVFGRRSLCPLCGLRYSGRRRSSSSPTHHTVEGIISYRKRITCQQSLIEIVTYSRGCYSDENKLLTE